MEPNATPDQQQKGFLLDISFEQYLHFLAKDDVLVLEKTGQRSRATQQISRCLLQDPRNRAYKQKKKELVGY